MLREKPIGAFVSVDLSAVDFAGFDKEDFDVVEDIIDVYVLRNIVSVYHEIAQRLARGGKVFPLSDREKLACAALNGVTLRGTSRSRPTEGLLEFVTALPVRFFEQPDGSVGIAIDDGKENGRT